MCMQTIHMSEGNAKLKKTEEIHGCKIVGFDLPAGDTCPYAGECKAICYARKCRFVYGRKAAYTKDNYLASLQPDFVQRMSAIINGIVASTPKKVYVRIHASGDFYCLDYAKKWAEIIRQCPSAEFYAYTKSVGFVRSIDWAHNMHVAFSFGGKQDDLIPIGATVAKIFDTEEEAHAAGYDTSVNNDDLKVIAGGKLGLIKH